jgi:hypothetical protein
MLCCVILWTGGVDAVWKLGLRPSVNTARPKKGQGKFGVGENAGDFFEKQVGD